MGAGEFERILGEKLRLDGPPPSGLPRPAPAFWPTAGSFQTPPFLSWRADTLPGAAAAFRRLGPKVTPEPAGRPVVPPPLRRQARLAHRLSAAQRTALETLRSMGADTLDEAFTAIELKRAFRALALRYHPDRHAGCPQDQHRELARAFAQVSQSYRVLLPAARA
jgi:hypothetical protein